MTVSCLLSSTKWLIIVRSIEGTLHAVCCSRVLLSKLGYTSESQCQLGDISVLGVTLLGIIALLHIVALLHVVATQWLVFTWCVWPSLGYPMCHPQL